MYGATFNELLGITTRGMIYHAVAPCKTSHVRPYLCPMSYRMICLDAGGFCGSVRFIKTRGQD